MAREISNVKIIIEKYDQYDSTTVLSIPYQYDTLFDMQIVYDVSANCGS